MTRRQIRALTIAAGIAVLAGTATLILTALQDNILFFRTPSDIVALDAPPQEAFRIGGMVKANSVQHKGDEVRFTLTDFSHEIEVVYQGILPDLFREGQGVVAEGAMRGKIFRAQLVLAKHDENYKPPELRDLIEQKESSYER